MTLKQALKTGKRFKRPNYSYWFERFRDSFTREEIYARDWVVEDSPQL